MSVSLPEDIVSHWQSSGGSASPQVGPRTGVSTILCTYQRPDAVSRFLRSLTGQTRLPQELLIVDASAFFIVIAP